MERSGSTFVSAALLPALLLAALLAMAPWWAGGFLGGTSSQAQAAPAAYQPAIVLAVTVSVAAGECGQSNTLDVPPGSAVYYCYTLTNNTAFTLTSHSLIDSRMGEIWRSQPFTLPSGVTTNTVALGVVVSAPTTADADNSATWSASTADGGQTLRANAAATVNMMEPQISLRKTVGRSAETCAADSSVTVAPGAAVHYCLTVDNTGDTTLIQHTIVDSRLGINHTFGYDLPPGQRLVVTQGLLDARGITASLTLSGVTGLVDNTASVASTTSAGLTAQGTATATVRIGTAAISVNQTAGTEAGACGRQNQIDIFGEQPVYYCVQVQNTGSVTVTRHSFYISNLDIGGTFSRPLAPGAIFTITNGMLSGELGLREMFGPYPFNGSLFSSLTYTATNDEGYVAQAASSSTVNVVTPTPPPTRPPDPTATWTPFPTATWTPTFVPPTNTPAPTNTLAPPTPTETPTRSYAVSFIATPTPAAISPLAAPTIESAAASGAAELAPVAGEASLAQAMIAPVSPLDTPSAAVPIETSTAPPMAPPVVPLPGETSTPLPDGAGSQVIVVTATPSPTSTPRPRPSATQRPIVPPPPPPTPDYVLLIATIVDKTVVAAGWIWFLLGSLVFFVVAGLVVGLSLRGQERRRFDLLPADEADRQAQQTTPAAPPPPPVDDEGWPPSLP